MTARSDSSGFTLIEMMVSSSIALIVMFALVGTFVFCQRMFRIAMAEAESTLAFRDIRDKLLFRAGPGLNSGLLTGKAVADGTSITMDWDDTAEGPGCMRIVWRNISQSTGSFFNERVPHTDANIKWFAPGGFVMRQNWAQAVDLPLIRMDISNPNVAGANQTGWILLPQ